METGEYKRLGSIKTESAPVQIIATMNFETDGGREDLVDRFKIIVDVPPLHERREDILWFIKEKYSKLKLDNLEVISFFAYNWPGNLRELDRILYEKSAKIDLPDKIFGQAKRGLDAISKVLNISFSLFNEENAINREDVEKIFDRVIPFDMTGYLPKSEPLSKKKIVSFLKAYRVLFSMLHCRDFQTAKDVHLLDTEIFEIGLGYGSLPRPGTKEWEIRLALREAFIQNLVNKPGSVTEDQVIG